VGSRADLDVLEKQISLNLIQWVPGVKQRSAYLTTHPHFPIRLHDVVLNKIQEQVYRYLIIIIIITITTVNTTVV
jgi:hypothetical protein